MNRLTIATGATVLTALTLTLAGCGGHGVTVAPPVRGANPFAQSAFNPLWPRPGTAAYVCGPVSDDFSRCVALVRTDIPAQLESPAIVPSGYTPKNLQKAYALTTASTNSGKGVKVALVDAFDDPKAESDLAVYRSHFGLPPCTTANGCFTKVKFTSATDTGWAAEESLDVDMVSAICPNCHILLVEAASNSNANLSSAERYATAHANFVNNSWSGNEGSKTFDASYNATGVAIVAATGDSGFNTVAQWPAILTSVTAVGGTSLTSISPRVESAWNGSGSGCSKIYAKPSFQTGITTKCAKRAQADVSADGDPNTGVAAYDSFNEGGWLVFGGTSVGSPIITAVFALVNNKTTNDDSFIYAHKSHLNDVVSGSNGSCGAPLCAAKSGWDGPTGLGTPNGIAAF